jgi:hypothetical protein
MLGYVRLGCRYLSLVHDLADVDGPHHPYRIYSLLDQTESHFQKGMDG